MEFYTNAIQYGNNILFRGFRNGERVQERVPFSPTLFVQAKEPSKYKSIYGDYLKPIRFDEINSAKEFIENYKKVDNFPIYGNTNYAYQFIAENYKGDIEFDLKNIRIVTLDIETSSDNGFPDTKNPEEEVLLITLQDYNTKEVITYGTKPYKANGTHYVLCSDERELLTRFLSDWQKIAPDVITGWNIEFFDIPYLAARITKRFGEATARKLSPWNVVRRKELERAGRIDIQYELYGISILDYLDLYRKFTYSAQESYKLDHIAKVELGTQKLSYDEFDSFKDFYTNDWQKFVEYNIVDCRLVDALEEKMKLIELIITMAFDAKSNFNDIFSAVRTWDCTLYNHLLDQNIIVQQRPEVEESSQIVGGYVKEPVPGQYDWVVSFDATSLYPSIIMSWNMSPEMLLETNSLNIKIDKLIRQEEDLEVGNYSVAANGYMFAREKQGLFPEIVAKLFQDRQTYKKLMLKAQSEYESTKDPKYQNLISRYNNRQMARKIQLNSLFGAMANQYFRFFDNRIAEGITMTGQYIIQHVSVAVNNYLNKICGTKNHDFAFYADTDSCYITLDTLVKKFYKDLPRDKVIEVVDKICKEKLTEVINKACDDLSNYTNAFEKKIIFKREAIADRGIWIAKKRYALNVYDNEGVRYKDPKLKVMGLEIVRSSTPEVVRKYLKEAVRLALTSDEQTLQDYIMHVEEEFMMCPVEDIAFPRSVNGMVKYKSLNTIYVKGTPMHVRGALMFNHLLSEYKILKKYDTIKEGDKIKFIYLKEPNHIRENCIAFTSKLPAEFELDKMIDYNMMFEKTFLDPISTILNTIKWNAKPVATLEGLFV